MNLTMFIIKSIFWICFSLMSYVYFLYPALIASLSRLFDKNFLKAAIEPTVSVIITAYNEEADIAEKLENTLLLEYPKHKMEVIVGSDGSEDQTDEIVKSFESKGIRLVTFDRNRGKTMVQNDCVDLARHEIIVFMDASSLCEPDAIRKLVMNLSDPRVGAVAGRVEFVQSKENLTTRSQGLYWQYEQMLKMAESRLGSLVGVDGPLYAIRKSLYIQLSKDIISDLITPLLVLRDGYSVVYEADAITYEEATRKTADELKTRRRIVARGIYGLSRYPELFHVFHHPLLSWQIISHKILRWLAGFYFLIMLACSMLLLINFAYMIIFTGIVAFLCFAYHGFKAQENCRKVFAVPYYFILVNWAALLGTIDFIRGKKIISWKPLRI